MTLLSQYERYKGYILQNVLYHMKDDFFVEKSKSQKNAFSWVLTERVTYYCPVLNC